jgi:hypothetical protein
VRCFMLVLVDGMALTYRAEVLSARARAMD